MTSLYYLLQGLIPDINAIPKTPTNYKKTTTQEKLITGKSSGGIKVKLFQQEGSSFARIQYDHNKAEYIYKMRADGCYEDGLYRERTVNGDTEIGSDYYNRWGRKVKKVYFLKRFAGSGTILYREETKDTEVIDHCRFNAITLKWTKFV